MKPLRRTSQPQPYDHVTWCPLCGQELWVVRGGLLNLVTRTQVAIVEETVKTHLELKHPFRYWVWSKLGKPLTKPGSWLITGT